jgi:hypothetical protein
MDLQIGLGGWRRQELLYCTTRHHTSVYTGTAHFLGFGGGSGPNGAGIILQT